jgi:Zn finger protein HypA/HybF involved in hydrogenase expression
VTLPSVLLLAKAPRPLLAITHVDIFAFYSPILDLMFPGPESSKRVVVQCKGCGENIPAPVETMPSQPIAARCPLCHEHRRYLPSEVFLGRFKGKPNFDFSLPCPLCGYKIQPNELMRLSSHIIQCPKCGRAFDEMGGRNPISTS